MTAPNSTDKFTDASRVATNGALPNNYPAADKGERGFSLVELLIVVALVATLAAIAIPNISRTLELQRLDSASSLIASKLAEARMNAIKRNRQAWVMVDPNSRRIQVQTTNDAGANIAVDVGTSLPTGVSFSAPTAATQIRFDSMGRLPAGTASWTVTLQGSNRRKSIGVSVLGRVTVTDMVTYTP